MNESFAVRWHATVTHHVGAVLMSSHLLMEKSQAVALVSVLHHPQRLKGQTVIYISHS